MGRLAILGLTDSILGWERSRVVLGSLLGGGGHALGRSPCSSRVRLVLQGQEQAGLFHEGRGWGEALHPPFDLQPHPWQTGGLPTPLRHYGECLWALPDHSGPLQGSLTTLSHPRQSHHLPAAAWATIGQGAWGCPGTGSSSP